MNLNEDFLSLDLPLPPDVARRKAMGDLAGALRLIDRYLGRNQPELAPRLRAEKARLERLPRDYPYDRAAALAQMREEWPDLTEAQFDALVDAGRIDWRCIDGVPHFHEHFLGSLRIYPAEAPGLKQEGEDHTPRDAVLERMEREGDRPPEAARFRRSGYRMMRLSREMEELAAAENGMMEMQFSLEDLTALCRELEGQIRPLLEKQGIRLVCRLPQEPLYCRVDRDKIRRSILHLVSNAVIAQMGQGRMVIYLRTRGEDVLLSVTDCGEGVSGMDFQDIFRKFDRMDPSRTAGTGLGLALVRSFIEKHGGRVVLMSNEGEGASAQITIPWVQDGGSDTVRSGRAAYGTGVDPILVELSNILSAEAFETEGV